MIDFLGHVMYAVLILGTWLAGKGYRIGWLIRMGGDCGWLILGSLMGMTSIVVWSAVFYCVDAVAFLRKEKP